jgi:acetyl esterase/lipase
MRVISPLLGYTLKTIYQPLELFAKYRELALTPKTQNVRARMNLSYGDAPEQVLDIYVPQSNPPKEPSDERYPVVIYVHGGSFVAGDKCITNSICRQIASHGYVVYNINYRLAPKYTYAYQIQDLAEAAHWVCQHGPQHLADPQQIFLMGDTTGANLILTYATALSHPYLRNALNMRRHIEKERLQGLALLYGAYDLEAGLFSNIPFIQYWHAMLLGDQTNGEDSWLSLASPLRHLHYHLPPIFLAAGEADPLFSQSILLARKLKEMRHPYATAFFDRENHPDGQHLFFALQFKNCAHKMLQESLLFLEIHKQQAKDDQHNPIAAAVS